MATAPPGNYDSTMTYNRLGICVYVDKKGDIPTETHNFLFFKIYLFVYFDFLIQGFPV